MGVIMAADIYSEIALIAIIAAILVILFVVIKEFLKLIAGIIINSILGLIALYILNTFFSLQIPLALYTIIPTALFGLPAVGTFVILRLFGIPI